MTPMTDSRAVEVLSEMREGDVLIDEADYVAAIDHAIARLREPAEAQAQGGGEVELRHMVAKLAAHVRPTCGELWAEAERLLNSTAPPSAPVGVEAGPEQTAAGILNRIRQTPEYALEKKWLEGYQQGYQHGLSEQSAAVDGAYHTPRNRAEAVALARLALAYLGVIDAHIDAAIARCETIAAQQQGGAE